MEIGAVYYNSSGQWVLNLVLASMILGVALDIQWRDFKAILTMPKAIIAGLTAQFVALPALTTALTLYLDLPAGIELGMILVASCPGGAISNFVLLAIVMLPLNLAFWSQFNPETAAMITAINVSAYSLFINLVWVLAAPLALGLFIQFQWPKTAMPLHKILKLTSTVALFIFIGVAVYSNREAFLSHFQLIFTVVLLHNAAALLLGFLAGKTAGMSVRDTKAITIEVGMQNSSLAIAIVFTQFNGEAGMALISAFWGTWHIVSGLIIALLFSRWSAAAAAPTIEPTT